MDNEATCQNTDLRIWRKTQDPLSPSIHLTKGGGIGINVAGRVIVMPVEKWHALGMIELGMEKSANQPETADQPHTPASLLDWAETLLCDPSNRISPLYSAKQWDAEVKAWRDAKNSAATPRDQADSHPTNEEIIKAARQYGRDHVTGPVFEAFANGARWARVMQRMLQTGDENFIRADHKPEDPTCDHSVYVNLPEPRPRHCPTCGSKMWDAGD